MFHSFKADNTEVLLEQKLAWDGNTVRFVVGYDLDEFKECCVIFDDYDTFTIGRAHV